MNFGLWSRFLNLSNLSHSTNGLHTSINASVQRRAKKQMRAEMILLVAEHGGEAVARREAMKMADDLSEANRKVSRITDNVLYRTLVGPLYRLIRSWTKSSSQA